MFRLIALFVLTQLAIGARYLILGKFEPISYASTYLFLAAAIVVYFVGKYFAKKEETFVPTNTKGWTFLLKQHVYSNKKALFKDGVYKGTLQRTYIKKWHYYVADFINEGLYLALTVQLQENCYEVIPATKKLFTNQSYWDIKKNGEKIGTAKTVVDLKNIKKLTEVIEMTVGEEVFTTAATTVSSKINIQLNEQKIGEMNRSSKVSNVHVLTVEEEKQLLPLLIHSFYFKVK